MTRGRAYAACLLLGAALAAPAKLFCADLSLKLMEFGASVAPPAEPVPLPEWAAPGPSGITVDAAELPPTPVPPVLTLPEIVPIPAVAEPASLGESREDARVPAHASDEIPQVLDPALSESHAAAASPAPKPMRFVVRGNRSLSADVIKAILAPYVTAAGSGALQAACEALQQAYALAGRPFVRVKAAPSAENAVLFEIAEPKLRSMQVVPVLGSASRPRANAAASAASVPGLRMTRALWFIRSKSGE